MQLLKQTIRNISKEQKSVFLHGDFNVHSLTHWSNLFGKLMFEIKYFNINLLNYNVHNLTNELLDSFASNSFISLILQPTRIASHSNTLIDNILSDDIDPDTISGNLTATISDHLPQFLIIPNIFGNVSGNKSNIYEWDWSKFDQENFILDFFC